MSRQGGLGFSQESIALLLNRISTGNAYRRKITEIDEAERNTVKSTQARMIGLEFGPIAD